MEKNMSALQPRTLSNSELIKYFAMYMNDTPMGAPLTWQIELLRRFAAVATEHAYPIHNDTQLDLFK